ncbi:luciferase-like monooxygenase [Klebsiella pneumoniae]|nr:luciferase-like monooxygenase [Klebsiella pneumoniae]
MTDKSVPFSVLDLAPIPQGSSAKEAFTHSLDLARLAESRGYHRYWLAEHHNMVGIASAATSVLIGYLAANTTTLHLGSGGVMLPNHSPLVIAEQFGTLNTLYPGRIDLGLGRAPGSDQPTMRALRRHMSGDVDNFPRDVAELVDWFDARDPNPHVRPVPGYGERIPVWLLGSSLYSAQLAAQLGLPFAFASHFAPDMLFQALHLYRSNFKPSARLEKTVRDGVYQYHRRRQQPRCGVSLHLHATGVCEAASRRDRSVAAAGGKYASAVVSIRAVWCAAGTEHVAGRR